MATKRFKELKALSKDELATKLREFETQMFEIRMKKVTGQLTTTADLWKLRKDIARSKMLLGAPSGQVKRQAATAAAQSGMKK